MLALKLSSRKLCTSSRHQQPWALPFAINERKARDAFSDWTKASSTSTQKFALTSIRPEFLPFYCFEGRLHGTFTGVLIYRRRETYTDSNGKSHSRIVEDEYVCPDIPFAQHVGADLWNTTYVYAGFEYRHEYVEDALLRCMSAQRLSKAVRLNQAAADVTAGVGAFSMKPSFAFARMYPELKRHAGSAAMKMMRTGQIDHLQYQYRGFGLLWGLWGYACPAKDWMQPDDRRVDAVTYDLDGARLCEHGVVLLPAWIVEYTHGGEPFRAFVGGIDGRVAGLPHLGKQDATWRGGTAGFVFGGLTALAAKPMAPLVLLSMPFAGMLLGASIGYGMAAMRQRGWEEAGRKRKRDAEQNAQWQAQAFWQAEVRRVLMRDGGASRRSRFDRKREQQQQQQQQQRRQGWSSGAQAEETGWRHLDDYALLKLARSPPPTAAMVAAAYRREAMKWHPDHHMNSSAAEQHENKERFQKINDAYGRLRRQAKDI